MKVAGIFIYPIKSCRGIALEQTEVSPKGLVCDREWMLVDQAGNFLTQRQYPQLATIQVEIQGQSLRLSTIHSNPFILEPQLGGDEKTVQVWRDRVVAIDQGDEVAKWFQQALNLPAEQKIRLVRQSPQHIRPIDKNYTNNQELPVSFSDGFPILLTATASLADLNQRLEAIYPNQSQTVPMNRFRPNLVIETEEPFIESSWQEIQINNLKFALVKPCSRCVVTTTDQFSGDRNLLQEPLKTLSTFRQIPQQGIMFGENVIPLTPGWIKMGDNMTVLKQS
ncbi:MAG: MOSC N-terminal beta barrel domain-containing protein [Snowella sp.]|nr:MOSC N-terminal beta barrel domain-containing protein [Snowella sp.]